MHVEKFAGRAAIEVAVALIVVAYALMPDARFGRKAFDSLSEGMTDEQVCMALGCPPGDYRPRQHLRPSYHTDVLGWPIVESGLSDAEVTALGRRRRPNTKL
jgi:hypothetical protein